MSTDPRLESVPAGRLIGIPDIAVLLGVKRETVDGWRVRDRRGRQQASAMPTPVLPRPDAVLTTPMWDREEVLAWAHATGRIQPVRRAPAVPDVDDEDVDPTA